MQAARYDMKHFCPRNSERMEGQVRIDDVDQRTGGQTVSRLVEVDVPVRLADGFRSEHESLERYSFQDGKLIGGGTLDRAKWGAMLRRRCLQLVDMRRVGCHSCARWNRTISNGRPFTSIVRKLRPELFTSCRVTRYSQQQQAAPMRAIPEDSIF